LARLILRYPGGREAAAAALKDLQSIDYVTVLDASPRMVLAEVPDDRVESLRAALPGWKVSAEQTVPLPSPPGRRKLRAPS